jgi:5-methylcytosine-specific restriction endonuclease McrA
MKKKIISLDELYSRDGGMCRIGKHPIERHEATRDHIRPQSKYGDDSPSNIQLACGPCNSAKGHSFSPFRPSGRPAPAKKKKLKSLQDFLPDYAPVNARNRSVL